MVLSVVPVEALEDLHEVDSVAPQEVPSVAGASEDIEIPEV